MELGPLDEEARALAERAAGHLLVSAERARIRGDTRAGQVLLEHAVDLLPDDHPAWREAQVELAVILTERGDFEAAAAHRSQAEAAAHAAGDERVLARVVLARVEAEILQDPTVTMRDSLATSELALAELERLGDDEGVAWALKLVGNFKAWLGSSAEAEVLWTRALELAENLSPRLANQARIWMIWPLWWGPTPVDEGIRRCDELLRQTTSKHLEATARLIRGNLKAAQGSFEEGRADSAAGRMIFEELGDLAWWAGTAMVLADIELLAGSNERAYELLTEGHTVLAKSHETGYLATVVGMRAQAALELGRDDEALELADETVRMAALDDFEPLARTRLVRARALARRGDFTAAAELIREAAEIVEPTDEVMLHLEHAFAQADIERLAGRPGAERAALKRALEMAEAKGNRVAAERASTRLAEL